MFYISDVMTTPPAGFKTGLQEKVYQALSELTVPFRRVDTDEAITMEDCVLINQRLDMKMVKTLFLCNSRKTDFFLFVTPGDKPFRGRGFSDALKISRVSFAPAELMETLLGTKVGAATVFSALLDSSRDVHFVFDRDVTREEWYGCSDGTTTGYMKVATEKIMKDFFSHANRSLSVIDLS